MKYGEGSNAISSAVRLAIWHISTFLPAAFVGTKWTT
jgi:hypothetical protein